MKRQLLAVGKMRGYAAKPLVAAQPLRDSQQKEINDTGFPPEECGNDGAFEVFNGFAGD